MKNFSRSAGLLTVVLFLSVNFFSSPLPAADGGRAEQFILAKLEQPVREGFNFAEVPLSDFVNRLKQDYEIPIVIDLVALTNANIATDTLITKDLKGVSLKSALNLTLRDHHLAWIVGNEVLQITTAEEADKRMVRRVYPVAELVSFKDGQGEYQDFDELLATIHKTIAPGTWNVGPAVTTPAAEKPATVAKPAEARGAVTPSFASGAIIVLHRADVHEEIQQLLTTLGNARKSQGITSRVQRPRSAAAVSAPLKAATPVAPKK